MKKVITALAASFFVMPSSFAAEITSRITDSVQLGVQGAAVQSTRIGASYSASGTNIQSTSFGGVGGAGTYDINTAGQAFTFSETFRDADTAVTTGALELVRRRHGTDNRKRIGEHGQGHAELTGPSVRTASPAHNATHSLSHGHRISPPWSRSRGEVSGAQQKFLPCEGGPSRLWNSPASTTNPPQSPRLSLAPSTVG